METVLLKLRDPQAAEDLREALGDGFALQEAEDIEELAAVYAQAHPRISAVLAEAEDAPLLLRMLNSCPAELPPPLFVLDDDTYSVGWLQDGAADILMLPLQPALAARRIEDRIVLRDCRLRLRAMDYDPLTGLLNLAAFQREARRRIAAARTADFHLLIADIEAFKRINERYGTEQADTLLAYIGGELRGYNTPDALFCRYAGDRFACLYKGGTLTDGEIDGFLARLLRQAPIERLCVRLGVYDDLDTKLPLGALCERTEFAVDCIKHGPEQRVMRWSPALQERYLREQMILSCSEEEHPAEEFCVRYLPRRSPADGSIAGANALLLWQHPELGTLTPEEYSPLLQRNGFMETAERYLLEKACAALEGTSPDLRVYLPLTRGSLLRGGFAEEVLAALAAHGVSPAQLGICVEEETCMQEAELLLPALTRLAQEGIRVELTEYGRGASSPRVMNALPLSGVCPAADYAAALYRSGAMLANLTALMHSIGLAVTLPRLAGCDDAALRGGADTLLCAEDALTAAQLPR